ncbi:FixJ family two-component response regulator [Ochrobactrum daejeonense]|uniref:Polar-differentiation response regulator DivK n=1 Tax=Brucella daejeonensis TaxID=659015 RepID=A0A7W9B0Z7_9HYPH|nr:MULTISPECIES: response regulator [Brucella]MBB5704243.1 FixJ family two-component response regulator [Brucella daejeonensis]NKB80174.1 response regulator [Brucella daejeonensis]
MIEEKLVIAVVDDDSRLLESMEDLLESTGYVARCFSSPVSLLTRGLGGIDLVITDIGMPDINGFELREIVQEVHPDIPVFLITGRHEIADQERAQGITGFFRKPFDGQALLAAIGEALHKRRMEGGHEN